MSLNSKKKEQNIHIKVQNTGSSQNIGKQTRTFYQYQSQSKNFLNIRKFDNELLNLNFSKKFKGESQNQNISMNTKERDDPFKARNELKRSPKNKTEAEIIDLNTVPDKEEEINQYFDKQNIKNNKDSEIDSELEKQIFPEKKSNNDSKKSLKSQKSHNSLLEFKEDNNSDSKKNKQNKREKSPKKDNEADLDKKYKEEFEKMLNDPEIIKKFMGNLKVEVNKTVTQLLKQKPDKQNNYKQEDFTQFINDESDSDSKDSAHNININKNIRPKSSNKPVIKKKNYESDSENDTQIKNKNRNNKSQSKPRRHREPKGKIKNKDIKLVERITKGNSSEESKESSPRKSSKIKIVAGNDTIAKILKQYDINENSSKTEVKKYDLLKRRNPEECMFPCWDYLFHDFLNEVLKPRQKCQVLLKAIKDQNIPINNNYNLPLFRMMSEDEDVYGPCINNHLFKIGTPMDMKVYTDLINNLTLNEKCLFAIIFRASPLTNQVLISDYLYIKYHNGTVIPKKYFKKVDRYLYRIPWVEFDDETLYELMNDNRICKIFYDRGNVIEKTFVKKGNDFVRRK